MRYIKNTFKLNSRYELPNNHLKVLFYVKKGSYPVEIKNMAIEMRLAGIPLKEVLSHLNIRNHIHQKT
ncbi:hypothetical protein BUW91_05725 [Priestia megaterium]|nr:hypothetical protein BUW91_05725 [Priestia megaterium]